MPNYGPLGLQVDTIETWSGGQFTKRRCCTLSREADNTALLAYIADEINRDYGASFFRRPANWLAVYVPLQPKTKSIGEVAVRALASICNGAHGISAERLLLARL